MAITFQNKDIALRLPGRMRIKAWIRRVLKQEGKKEGEINFVFTSDEHLHEVNLQYLSHDTYTDIITFDQTEGLKVSGDIMISVDRVKDNAGKFKSGFEDELRRVIIHGVFHLCGYKDKTAAEEKTMRIKENEALRIYELIPD